MPALSAGIHAGRASTQGCPYNTIIATSVPSTARGVTCSLKTIRTSGSESTGVIAISVEAIPMREDCTDHQPDQR